MTIIRNITFAFFIGIIAWFSASYFDVVAHNLSTGNLAFWNIFEIFM